jgi:hypothetical protein
MGNFPGREKQEQQGSSVHLLGLLASVFEVRAYDRRGQGTASASGSLNSLGSR